MPVRPRVKPGRLDDPASHAVSPNPAWRCAVDLAHRGRAPGYTDHYGNPLRALRASPPVARRSRSRRILTLASPADRIEPDTGETPVGSLPDEVLSFVMPSRFCLPDGLGHEAWQRLEV